LRLLVAELDAQAAAGSCDRQVSVAESADQVEWFAWLLFERETHGVLLDVLLNRFAHVRSSSEEPVRWYQPLDAAMGSLEVVRIDEEPDASRAVGEVGKNGARQKLLPQRLPEPFHFAERLRMLRSALDVPDALAPKLLFELRLASPRRVLTTVVRQNLFGRAVLGHPVQQRLHHQARLLVVPERIRDDEPGVVVHEGCQVDPLVASQQEGEDVRLPQLVGSGPLESAFGMFSLLGGRGCLDEAFFVKNPTNLRFAHTQGLEAS